VSADDRIPARWDRVVLKVSGEAFAGEAGYGIDGEIVGRIARDIADVRAEFAVDIAVVVGGGNIWRGMSGAGAGMDRAQADYMGMLATSINALALQDTLEQLGQAQELGSVLTRMLRKAHHHAKSADAGTVVENCEEDRR
jgi:uridylate kinase